MPLTKATQNVIETNICTTDTTQTITGTKTFSNLSGNASSATALATGSTTARTLANRFDDVVNVKDFGAFGDGNLHPLSEQFSTLAAAQAVYGTIVTSLSDTFDFAAIQKAIYYVAAQGGGKVFIPDGKYMMSQQVEIFSTATPGWSTGFSNITFEGCGFNTVLDFSPSAVGQNGISCRYWGGRIEVSRIVVLNSKNVGIEIGQDSGPGTYQSRLNFHDIVIQGSASHGMRLRNTYVGSFSDIESRVNGGDGFHLGGFHTGLTFTRCWAGGGVGLPALGNQGHGWYINDIVYSTFISCAADENGLNGYKIQNANAVGFVNCGSEANQQDGFYIVNVVDAARASASVKDISALTLDGCFAIGNGANRSTGVYNPLYANLFRIETYNDLPLSINTRSCYDLTQDISRRAVILKGNSGRITIVESLNKYAGVRVSTGDVLPIIYEIKSNGNFSGNIGFGKEPTNFGNTYQTIQGYGSSGTIIRAESSSAIVDLYGTSDIGGVGVVRTASNHPLLLQTNGSTKINIATTGATTINTDITLPFTTTATTATAGTSGDTPAQVAGYLQVSINGTNRKIPFYAI
jgi:hypothetical protein